MSRHEDRITLRQLLDAAQKARSIGELHRREELDEDWILAYALRTALQILGEAAQRLSPSLRERATLLPSQEIIGLRHHLVHGYDRVDLDRLWVIVVEDLPPFIAAVEGLLAGHEEESR